MKIHLSSISERFMFVYSTNVITALTTVISDLVCWVQRSFVLFKPELWSRSPKILDGGADAGACNLGSGFAALSCGASKLYILYNTMVYSFQWTNPFWSRNRRQKCLNVGARAKSFRCLVELEPEPEI